MAETFSFEDALKPAQPETFSFEDAQKPRGPETFSFEEARQKPTVTLGPIEDAIKKPELQMGEPTSNVFKGVAARGAGVVGNLIEGIARVSEAGGDYIEGKIGLSGLSKEELESKRQLEPLFKWADSLKNWGQEINYQPSTKLSELTDNPLNYIPFVIERVATSVPDMAGAVLAAPAYVATRTNEILNDRLKNDDKQLKDVTVSDVAVAAGAAILETTFERFATKGLLKGQGITGANVASRVGKETLLQSGTEGIEEAIGYLGGTAGTKKGVDPSELAQNVIEGMLVGGGLGAAVQGTKEVLKTPEETTKAPTGETTDIQKQFNDIVTRYESLGAVTRAEAEKLANEDLKEAGYVGDQLRVGTSEPSVPVPNESSTTIEGTTETETARLAKPSVVAGTTRGGETNQLNTLEEIAPVLKEKYNLTDEQALEQAKEVLRQRQVSADFAAQKAAAANVPPVTNVDTTQQAGPTTVTPLNFKDVGSPESQKIQSDVNTMAHTLFNPNNVRTDGRPGWDKPPKNVEPVIDAFYNGGRDARGEFFYPEDYKNKKQKQAYELGHRYASSLMTGTPIDVARTNITEEAAKLITPAPKKGGRPKAEKTPEQIAAAAQTRTEQRNIGRDSIDEMNRLEKAFDKTENVDPATFLDKFPTEQEAKTAIADLKESRLKALTSAYKYTVGQFKNKAAGKRATALLEKATLEERNLAKQRFEMQQKIEPASRSELTDQTNGQNNPKYETFPNAKAAANWVAKNGTAFEKALAKRIGAFLNGVKLVIVDGPQDMPSASLQRQMVGAAGLYVEGRKTIYLLRNEGTNNTVFLHEGLHGATVNRINAYLQARLEGRPVDNNLRVAVKEIMETMDDAKQLYDKLSEQGYLDERMQSIPYIAFTDPKEFITYGLTLPAMQEFLLLAPGEYIAPAKGVIDKLFNRFVQSIRKILNMDEKHASALQDLIIITDKLLATNKSIEAQTKVDDAQAAKVAKGAKKTKEAEAKVDKDLEKIQASFESDAAAVGDIGNIFRDGHTFENIKELLNAKFPAMGNEFIKKLIYNFQTSDILKWKGDEIGGLKEIDALTQTMAAMRSRMLAASTKKAEQLAAFIRKNGQSVISSTMHLARLKKVTVDDFSKADGTAKPLADIIADDKIVKQYQAKIADPASTVQQKNAYKGKITTRTSNITLVHAQWEALGKQKGGHEMYKMVRQFYKDNYRLTRNILDDQVNALPIDDAAKARLLKSTRLMQEISPEDKRDLEDPDEFTDVDFDPLQEDYFPFGREGKYWLRVNNGPAGREFYLFDTGTARNLFLNRRAKKLGLDPNDTNFQKGDDITSLRKNFQDSSVMLQTMFAEIDKIKTTDKRFDPSNYPNEENPEAAAKAALDAYKDELKDQLYQTYLMTMPERSFRKQFLHSENVTGFSSDVLRNFKNSSTKFANQLSKLKYGAEIENQIQRARDTLVGSPAQDMSRNEIFINEIAARAREEINPPPPGQVVNRINRFAFFMLLTSAASAATQMASVPIMLMPTLNAKYGYGVSAAKFTKYLQVWKSIGHTQTEANGDVTYTAPSIGSSKLVKDNKVLENAFKTASDEYNLFQLTNTSILSSNVRTPDSVSASVANTAQRKFFNGISSLFSGAERMSREIAFMMTFELEYAKTKNFDASVKAAVETTHELLGRYDNMQRPRILKNAIGKTVGQFKMYAVHMTSWFLRNGNQVLTNGLSNAEGREAMHRLAGVLIMGGMFHGLVGMPLYSTICWTIDTFFDGDEEDKKRRRAKNPLTADNSNLRFRYNWLPENFGTTEIMGLDGRMHRLSDVLEKGPISSLTDMNIGSRTSFDNLWWREAKPGKTNLETAQNYILANLGPGVSTGVNMIGAIDDFGNGHIDRGLEKLVPAFFRGSFVAERMRKEGAETRGGADMLKPAELNELNYIASVLGFSPARLARIQEKNFEFQKEITKAQNERAQILKRLDEVAFNVEKEPGDMKAVLNQIREYNKRYPAEKFIISYDTIEKSLEAYGKKRGQTYRGQYIDPKLIPYMIKESRAAAPVPQE